MPFVKLDCKILDKSIWRESPETKIVWITMLAMADSDGLVEAAIPGIADRAKIPLEETEKAINTFQQPDKWSSNQDHEGRRIERVKEGFQILNYQEYRDKDYTAAARVKKYRECLRVTGVTKRSEYIYASEVLSYLNSKTGRKYRNFKNILPRLREGRTIEEMKQVIDTKLLDPHFIENPQYLNPETLFRPSNFDRYVNQRPADFNGNGKGVRAHIVTNDELIAAHGQRAAERKRELPQLIENQKYLLEQYEEAMAGAGLDEQSIKIMKGIPGKIKELERELAEAKP
jgi:uncharacterized phage protein (TIGR02220 family)